MKRTLEVLAESASWPGGTPPAFAPVLGATQISTLLALLYTALCTRPPIVTGFHLSDMWAWVRYGFAFDPGPWLRLKPEWDLVDPHQKTLLSDELGVGFTTSFLAKKFGCHDFADALYVAKALKPSSFSIGSAAKSGPAKSPDFIAIDPGGKYWIVECKGTQASRAALMKQLADGAGQKANLIPMSGTPIAHSIVVGLYIPQASSKQQAAIGLADPSWIELEELLEEGPPELVREAITQVSLAKQFALAGLLEAASNLATEPVSESRRLSPGARDGMRRRLEQPMQLLIVDSSDLWRRAETGPTDIGRLRLFSTAPVGLIEEILTKDRFDESIRSCARMVPISDGQVANEQSAAIETRCGFKFEIVID